MKEAAQLLHALQAAGVVSSYAVFGAAAQVRYTEPVSTFDLDVLVSVPDPDRLDVLGPIYRFCGDRGYAPEGEAIRVGSWPVQFIPVHDALTRDAVEEAETADFEGIPLRVVRADHLAAIALSVGRAKDHARILSLLESNAIAREDLVRVAERYQLRDAWRRFESRFLT